MSVSHRAVAVIALSLAVAAPLAGCRSTSESTQATASPEASTAAATTASPAQSATPAVTATNADGLPEGFVRLAGTDPSIVQEMRYAGDHNFVGSPIDGYDAAECWVTTPTAEALSRVQARVVAQGYTLKIYDCYRPQRAVDEFVAWASDPADTTMQAEFYPNVPKDRIIPDGYIAPKSGHSRGSTVDLTLVPLPGTVSPTWQPGDALVACTAPYGERFPDTSIDMGTGFDCFDVLSHTANGDVGATAMANRAILVDAMAAEGFRNLPEEWWHYTLNDEPYPDTYFDVPITAATP